MSASISLFQFHKGTIKTFAVPNGGDRNTFQFHKGTIKTTTLEELKSPILVSIP